MKSNISVYAIALAMLSPALSVGTPNYICKNEADWDPNTGEGEPTCRIKKPATGCPAVPAALASTVELHDYSQVADDDAHDAGETRETCLISGWSLKSSDCAVWAAGYTLSTTHSGGWEYDDDDAADSHIHGPTSPKDVVWLTPETCLENYKNMAGWGTYATDAQFCAEWNKYEDNDDWAHRARYAIPIQFDGNHCCKGGETICGASTWNGNVCEADADLQSASIAAITCLTQIAPTKTCPTGSTARPATDDDDWGTPGVTCDADQTAYLHDLSTFTKEECDAVFATTKLWSQGSGTEGTTALAYYSATTCDEAKDVMADKFGTSAEACLPASWTNIPRWSDLAPGIADMGPTRLAMHCCSSGGKQTMSECGLIEEKPCPPDGCASGACFSADMSAQLESGETVSMKDLQLGDKVLTSDGTYSDVHLFSKRDAVRAAAYVVLATATTEIALSEDHYVQSNGVMTLARYVKVGDMLSAGAVTAVKKEFKEGAYSPITLDGTIVVNGIVASSYTKKVNPSLSHMLLAPRRVAYYLAPEFMNGLAESCTSGCDTAVRFGKMAKKALRAAGLVSLAGMIGGGAKL